MDIEEFIGTWENKHGNTLIIKANDTKSVLVTFISGRTGKPVIRKYFNNNESIDMYAELDYYESSLEVDLWEKGKGYRLSLLYDWIDFRNEPSGYYLAPGIIRYEEDKLTEKFNYLFEPLDYYKKSKNSR